MTFPQFLAVFVIDDIIYAIAIAAMVASAATSFVGAQKSADAAEEAGRFQQKAADESARNVEIQNAENIRRERVNKRRRLARMRTQMAGTSGLVFEGTMQDAFTETAGQMELTIQDSARESAMMAQNTRSQGDMQLWQAKSQASAARIQSYGTLLSDASSIAGKVTA